MQLRRRQPRLHQEPLLPSGALVALGWVPCAPHASFCSWLFLHGRGSSLDTEGQSSYSPNLWPIITADLRVSLILYAKLTSTAVFKGLRVRRSEF